VTEKFVKFSCDGASLSGILHLPANHTVRLGIVIIVGGPQYRVGSHRQFVLTARALSAAGYPVLRFDYRGMGDSDGVGRTFEDVGVDVASAIDCVCREARVDSVILYGLCDAASAAMMYAVTDQRVRGLVLLNPWVRTDQGHAKAFVEHYYRKRFFQISFWRKLASGRLAWRATFASLSRNLYSAFGRADHSGQAAGVSYLDRMLNSMSRFDGASLVILSENDLVAREFDDLCKTAPEWVRLANSERVTFERLLGADHTFSGRPALDRSIALALRWIPTLPP
jgi:exosortase A-associated hydrolase 1